MIIICTFLYKLAAIGIGFSFAYLGYKLFVAGIFSGGGDLEATFRDNKLILKKAAPGIFFALFGTAILSIAFWKGMDLTQFDLQENEGLTITEKDKIAIDSIERIVSLSHSNETISDFEIEAMQDLVKKISNYQSKSVKKQVTRGIASEDD